MAGPGVAEQAARHGLDVLAIEQRLVRPDWTVAASRVAEVSEHWDDGRAADRLERSSATLLRGSGQIVGPAEVVVGGRGFAVPNGLVIATGTEPAIPSVDGLADVPSRK